MSDAGYCSRRAAEKLIAEGRVTVNGETAVLGSRADADDRICVDRVLITGKENEKIYIMLNKPRGYVTTMSDEQGRRNVAELVKDAGTRVYPVGRLDMYSEGLLLMTNDGSFANMLMHPSHMVTKTYRVNVTGSNLRDSISCLSKPMSIDGYVISPADVRTEIIEDSKAQLLIGIHEGRNRQIRKMCAECGLKVQKLCRISEGSLELGSLKSGKWRRLTDEEVEALRGSNV